MKRLFLFLLLTCNAFQYTNAQSCSAPTFTSQQQLNNFKIQNPGCKTISGSVSISGADITNLNGLSNITEINGDLTISNNTSLVNLGGLGSLTNITGRLTILNNPILLNVNGLESLGNIVDGINVESNPSLTDLSGLQSLSYVGTYLRVVYNASLTSVEAFNKITSVSYFLSVGANPVLESLSGLRNISSASSISIALNTKLINLDGLKSLTTVTGYLYIGYNPRIKNLQGLNKLQQVGNYLNITNNGELITLEGLDALEYSNFTQIQNNEKLSTCAIRSICKALRDNPNVFYVYANATGCESIAAISAACSSLPVDLIRFSGERKADGNILEWATAWEADNEGFEVESSTNGRLFEKIGFVKGSSDSKQRLDYSFTDKTSQSLTYYRLKQIDMDGTSTYSRIIAVKGKIESVSVYPNPSRGHLFIGATNRNQPYNIKNSQGTTVTTSSAIPENGIATASWQDGLYFLTVGSEVFKVLVDND